MKVVQARDCRGEWYAAYEAHTKSGFIVHVDKELADGGGDPRGAVAWEVSVAEKGQA